MARELREEDPAFPIDPEALERAYPVRDYESFCNWWNVVDVLEGDLDRYQPVLERHVRRLKAQHVVYTELMIASSEIPRDPAEAVEKMAEFRQWLDQREGGEIQIEILACFGRNRTPERIAELAVRNLALYEAGLIVGVALAGPEQGYPVKPFHKTFALYHEAGLGIEIHAGEWCGPESVWDALEYGFPDRVGHGVSLCEDPDLIRVIQERRIHIEFCPTSNLKTGSISRIEDHPIRRARDLGLSFSVNTDDPGPFETRMDAEYELLERVFGFEERDFRQLYEQSLTARFQSRLRIPAATRIGVDA